MRRRVSVVSASGIATILAIAVVAVVATGFTPSRARLLDGGAWLADDTNMPHASGPNAAVDAAVQRCPDPDDCRWVQRDGLAYLVQPRAGQVHRLDTSTRHFDQQGVSIGAGGSRLLVGTGQVYSIDADGQSVHHRDPVSLATIGEPVRPTGGAGDAIVDRNGVLWVIERGTGELLGIDGTSVRFHVPAGTAGGAISLGSIDDEPIVLDTASRTLVAVDDRGRERARIAWPELDAARVVVGRDLPAGPVYVLERGSGRVARIDLDSGSFEIVGRLDVGDDVNALYVVGPNVFAAQPNARVVRWLGLDDRHEREPVPDASEVFVKDGYLFANDVHARDAHVAGPDTDPQPILKRRDDIPKGEVPPQVNNYSPTPPSITTTTVRSTANPADTTSTTSSTRPSSTSTSTTAPAATTTLPAVDVPPAPPTNVTATGGDASASVRWNASPGSIDHYEVTSVNSPSINPQNAAAACPGADCSAQLSGLQNGNTYTFVVTAVSGTGARSTPSAPSNAVSVDANLPPDPGVPTAVGRSRTKVHVSFAAAPSNGRPVTEYVIQPLDLGKQAVGGAVTTSATSVDVDVPSPAPATYFFRVQARNDAGKLSSGVVSGAPAGPYGPPDAATPVAPSVAPCVQQPDAPVSLTVSWNPVSFDANDTAKGYKLSLNGQPQGNTLPSTVTSQTVTVASGRSATVAVTSTNESGDGPSSPVSFTCPTLDPLLESGALTLQADASGPSVSVTVTQATRSPDPGDPAKAGSACCYVALANPVLTIVETDTSTPFAATSMNPGGTATASISGAGLAAESTYHLELRSGTGEVLARTEFQTPAVISTTPGNLSSHPSAAIVPNHHLEALVTRRTDL